MPRTRIPLAGGNRVVPEHNFYDFRLAFPTTGNIWFVDSGASASGSGTSPEDPVTTIDAAINKTTASNGDVIYVMEGHSETISAAAGVAQDVAGLRIIGLGNHRTKPQITMATATAADWNISAANSLVKNIEFISNIDSLVNFLDIDSGDVTVEDCVFRSSSAKEFVTALDLASGSDRITVRNCKFFQSTDPGGSDGAAGTGAIYLEDSDDVWIESCWFWNNFETAIIHNKSSAALNLWVVDCYGISGLSGAEPLQLHTNTTGGTVRGAFITPAEAAVTEATLSGTYPANFFNFGTLFGNDGGGGQSGVASTSDAS